MTAERPTASTITDDQLDALWDALAQIEGVHQPDGKPEDYEYGEVPCGECGYAACETSQIIIRQRYIAEEPPREHPEEADHLV